MARTEHLKEVLKFSTYRCFINKQNLILNSYTTSIL